MIVQQALFGKVIRMSCVTIDKMVAVKEYEIFLKRHIGFDAECVTPNPNTNSKVHAQFISNVDLEYEYLIDW